MRWKWLAYPFALIAVAILLVGIAGAGVGRHYTVTVSAQLKTPPQKIWESLTDVEGYSTWRSDLQSVDRLPDKDGRLCWIENSKYGRARIEVEENQPNLHLVTRIVESNTPFEGARVVEIQPQNESTNRITVTENVDIANPFMRFISRFIIGHKKPAETYLKDLGKKLGEGEIQVEG
jgi:uncharacterized protein YndB with AHSA1/START domain